MKKKLIYVGHLTEGRIRVGDEIIVGKHGVPVEVSNRAFDALDGLKDWKGDYSKKKKEVKENG